MTRIGIDVGSTYTKYCIKEQEKITELFEEKTPIRQAEYFHQKLAGFLERFPDAEFISCGYGKENIEGTRSINELTALARGTAFFSPDSDVVLDIGGQDTKVIVQKDGRLQKFFINDRCAAGSGMFLYNTLNLLEKDFSSVKLTGDQPPKITLNSVCAVFAQSEIVKLLAGNADPDDIIYAVIWHILTQAKILLTKVNIGSNGILLSGGLTRVKDFDAVATKVLQKKCYVLPQSDYLSAIGCALHEL